MNVQVGPNGAVVKASQTRQVVSGTDPDHTAFTDRLWQRDPDKYDQLCEKHFGDTGQTNWDSREAENIEAFLRDWLGQDIVLVRIERKTNQANGYPYWRLEYVINDS